MITVSNAVEQIIKQKPILEYSLFKNLVNLSAVAREIKQEVEQQTRKKVTEGAIIMALRRLNSRLSNKSLMVSKIKPSNITVRSDLIESTYANSETLIEGQKKLLYEVEKEKDIFCNITRGMLETTIIGSSTLKNTIERIFQKEKLISRFSNLSSITIKHPEIIVDIPGVYHTILKLFAWEGINLVELASTYTELTLVFNEADINRAFSTLTNFFKVDK